MHTLRMLMLSSILLCAAAMSAMAQQSDLHVIVEVKEGCVIGGVQNRQWVAAEKFENSIKAPLNLELYTILDHKTQTFISEDAECHLWWKPQGATELKAGVAIQTPNWNPVPRTPRAISTQDPTYVSLIRNILMSAGLKKPRVNITEAYKIDLDGDGQDEAVLVASNFKHGVSELTGVGHATAAGDYALVLIRKIVAGKVQNIFLVKDVRHGTNEGGLPRGYHISTIADLNGDGRMEMALYSAYHEGSSSDIFERLYDSKSVCSRLETGTI